MVCGSDGVECPEMSSVFPGRDMRLPTDISRPDKYNTYYGVYFCLLTTGD